jgi:hypothetical protein
MMSHNSVGVCIVMFLSVRTYDVIVEMKTSIYVYIYIFLLGVIFYCAPRSMGKWHFAGVVSVQQNVHLL